MRVSERSREVRASEWVSVINTATMPDDAPQPRPDFYDSLSQSFAKLTHFIDNNIRVVQVSLLLTLCSPSWVYSENSCSRQPSGPTFSRCCQLVPAVYSHTSFSLTNTRYFNSFTSVTVYNYFMCYNSIMFPLHLWVVSKQKHKVDGIVG